MFYGSVWHFLSDGFNLHDLDASQAAFKCVKLLNVVIPPITPCGAHSIHAAFCKLIKYLPFSGLAI